MPHSGYTICTSEQRPTSTAVSHGFVVERYSSPPFGSHGPCKHSESCPLDFGTGVPCSSLSLLVLSLAVAHAHTHTPQGGNPPPPPPLDDGGCVVGEPPGLFSVCARVSLCSLLSLSLSLCRTATHHLGEVAFTTPFAPGFRSTSQHASSIDSLVRVSRRAESGTDTAKLTLPTCTLHHLGNPRPHRATGTEPVQPPLLLPQAPRPYTTGQC